MFETEREIRHKVEKEHFNTAVVPEMCDLQADIQADCTHTEKSSVEQKGGPVIV